MSQRPHPTGYVYGDGGSTNEEGGGHEGKKDDRDDRAMDQIQEYEMRWKEIRSVRPGMAVHLLHHGRQTRHGRQLLRRFALDRAGVSAPCYCWCAKE